MLSGITLVAEVADPLRQVCSLTLLSVIVVGNMELKGLTNKNSLIEEALLNRVMVVCSPSLCKVLTVAGETHSSAEGPACPRGSFYFRLCLGRKSFIAAPAALNTSGINT